ncbi:MAG: hypothetical protein JWN52_1135 [Actinomycetia bacterium]|nr:hypothetical protein [Actinomycetes bacterium]
MNATPSSTGKGQPAGAGSDSSSNGNGLASGNGGKPASSGVNSTVSSVGDLDEVKVEASAAEDGKKDDVTTPAGSSAGSSAKAVGKGTPPFGSSAIKDEQAKDYSPPWATSSEPSGSVFADRAGGSTTPAAGPLGSREFGGGAPSMSQPAQSGPSSAASSSFKNRVNDVMRPGKAAAAGKSPRKAHLQVSRFEPWSVMKFSFVMSLVCFIVLLVAVVVIYMVLSGLGVFDQIVQTINELTQDKNSTKSSSFDAASWFSFTRIFGYAALVGALNVLLITALATVWSVIYNIAADFVGGVEVTLKEAE